VVISPVAGSAAEAASSAGWVAHRRLAFDCLSTSQAGDYSLINKAYAHASLHVLLRAEAKTRFCAFHNRLVQNPHHPHLYKNGWLTTGAGTLKSFVDSVHLLIKRKGL
jgi:hypothetical protein